MSALFGFSICFISTLIVLGGDYLIMRAVEGGAPILSFPVIAGALLFGASAFGFYLALRFMTLSQMGVAYSVFSLLALCAMGVWFFGETLVLRDFAGILLALGAIGLMARFA